MRFSTSFPSWLTAAALLLLARGASAEPIEGDQHDAAPPVAEAEPPKTVIPTAGPPATASVPTWRTTGDWGWLIVGSGLAAGAAVTTYGLTIDCKDTDHACGMRSGIAIWSGIGVAAIASAVGLSIIERGATHVQVSAARSSHAWTPELLVFASF